MNRRIRIPTIWNTKVSQKESYSFLNEILNFSDKQAERNTGTIKHIDTKIQCPKCKGVMHRAYKEVTLLLFKMKSYVGWLCQNKKCLHYIPRAEVYKDWGHDYKKNINLEIE